MTVAIVCNNQLSRERERERMKCIFKKIFNEIHLKENFFAAVV